MTNTQSIPTDAFGTPGPFRFAKLHAAGRRVWATDSSGSYGSGLATFLLERGEWVIEIDRPARPANRNAAMSDELNAVRAAREVLSREHLVQPRRRGDREALRVLLITRRGAIRSRTKAINHLKALVITSREELRHQLRRHDTDELINRCARLRTLPSQSVEHRATIMALRYTARRIVLLETEANDLETEIERLVKTTVPWLLDELCVGPITARSSSALGHTPGGSVRTARPRCCPAQRRSPHLQDRRSASG